jgi:hypothetical protein
VTDNGNNVFISNGFVGVRGNLRWVPFTLGGGGIVIGFKLILILPSQAGFCFINGLLDAVDDRLILT